MDSLKSVLRLVVDDHLAALAGTQGGEEAPRWELREECRLRFSSADPAYGLDRQADHPVLVLCAVPGVPLAIRGGNVLCAPFRESQRPV